MSNSLIAEPVATAAQAQNLVRPFAKLPIDKQVEQQHLSLDESALQQQQRNTACMHSHESQVYSAPHQLFHG